MDDVAKIVKDVAENCMRIQRKTFKKGETITTYSSTVAY